MCDYSLQHVASRPAAVGDELITTRFNNSVTIGFAAIGAPGVAVCLLPGTEVAFDQAVEYRAPLLLLFRRRKLLDQTVARFRQINPGYPSMHHDALEFPNGEIVLLTDLYAGQRAAVLQLPARPKTAAEAKAQERVWYVE